MSPVLQVFILHTGHYLEVVILANSKGICSISIERQEIAFPESLLHLICLGLDVRIPVCVVVVRLKVYRFLLVCLDIVVQTYRGDPVLNRLEIQSPVVGELVVLGVGPSSFNQGKCRG